MRARGVQRPASLIAPTSRKGSSMLAAPPCSTIFPATTLSTLTAAAVWIRLAEEGGRLYFQAVTALQPLNGLCVTLPGFLASGRRFSRGLHPGLFCPALAGPPSG